MTGRMHRNDRATIDSPIVSGRTWRSLRELAAYVVLLVLCSYQAQAGGESPSAVVSSLQAGLLSTMKQAKALGIRGRYERLTPVIKQNLDLPLIMATASAPYWQDGTQQQRSRVRQAFLRMIASQVATYFDDYGGETFRVVRERKTGGPTVLVDTQVVRPQQDTVHITYVTAKAGNRWWIIDIIVEGGISAVKVHRSEFLALLKQGGLDGLAHALNTQADTVLLRQVAATPAPRN